MCGRVWSNFTVGVTAELYSNFFGGDFTTGIVAPLDILYKSAAKNENRHKKWQRLQSMCFLMLVEARSTSFTLF